MNNELLSPKSIVVVGGSNDLHKPGGSIVRNLKSGKFNGKLHIVNPKHRQVQGTKTLKSIEELEAVELAILVIPAHLCVSAVRVLAEKKQTKAFIILSAGFSEVGKEGSQYQNEILALADANEAVVFGPNCIGLINNNYDGVFTSPVPAYDPNGCDLISSSGATAVFLIEAGLPIGLRFANVFSVGNGVQIGVEEVLEHLDKTFDSSHSSKIKLIYVEDIRNPYKFFIHTSSLIKKGCKIAAIKSGASKAGSRAASSHTGAMATSDVIIRALFRKAGIVYCSGRNQMITAASIFSCKELKGPNLAVITHAGGSAVMLTDALEKGGLCVPEIKNEQATELLKLLDPGSSVDNPIDFLATGTATQLEHIIEYCEHAFDKIDGMVIVFGSSGLFNVREVYKVLDKKMQVCKKPIFPVLPSTVNAQKEVDFFISRGRVNFPDEVILGEGLSAVYNTPIPEENYKSPIELNKDLLRQEIKGFEGYLDPIHAQKMLGLLNIKTAGQIKIESVGELENQKEHILFPIVAKAIGPIHKTDIGGVALGINDMNQLKSEVKRILEIEKVHAVLIQEQVKGLELYVGAKYEEGYGHVILFGLGGVNLEVFKDIKSAIAPVTYNEANNLIKRLRSYKVMKGYRGKEGINLDEFVSIIMKISALVRICPSIIELDLNPLMATKKNLTAVDIRIKTKYDKYHTQL